MKKILLFIIVFLGVFPTIHRAKLTIFNIVQVKAGGFADEDGDGSDDCNDDPSAPGCDTPPDCSGGSEDFEYSDSNLNGNITTVISYFSDYDGCGDYVGENNDSPGVSCGISTASLILSAYLGKYGDNITLTANQTTVGQPAITFRFQQSTDGFTWFDVGNDASSYFFNYTIDEVGENDFQVIESCDCSVPVTTATAKFNTSPCNQITTVNTMMSSNTINSQNTTISNYLTTSPNEWGVDERLTSLGGNIYFNNSPTIGNAEDWPIPQFYWDSTNGYTMGFSHSHPSAGPDTKDLGDIYSTWLTNMRSKSSSDQLFFQANFAVTTILKTGTYTEQINDWNAFTNIIINTYGSDFDAMKSAWQTIAGNYLTANNSNDTGMAGAFAIMQMFGSSVNMSFKAADSNTFSPLMISGSAAITNPCN